MRDGNSRGPGGPAEPGAVAEPASVHVIVQDGRTRIVLSGEVDADLAADLTEATTDAEAAGLPIDIDAQHVTFMDSSGVAFLARIATRSAHPVRMLRVPETVKFLLDVTRIGELLEVVADEDTAAWAVPTHDLPTIGPNGRTPAAGTRGPDDVA